MNPIVLRNLRPRLQHLYHWILAENSYDAIWDLCCDHGLLGLHLSQSNPTTSVYLVDSIASIVSVLKDKYSSLNSEQLQFLCMPAENIKIDSTHRNLIIIAGVGGETCIDILQPLFANCKPNDSIDIMLSPNSHLYNLRLFLHDNNVHLYKEDFVCDKAFCHEHLHLRFTADGDPSSKPISLTGDKLWHPFDTNKRIYIEKIIGHLRRVSSNIAVDNSDDALHAYQQLIHELPKE